MDFYVAENKAVPWGDYGVVLLEGFTGELGKSRAAIERTGPFAPPIVISSGHLIVTDPVRRSIQSLKLRGISFRECVKQKIVDIPWTDWDPKKDPPKYPAGGEPENYILRRKHNERLAKRMPDLWELVIPADGAIVGRVTKRKTTTLTLYENTWNKADVFRAEEHCDDIFFTQRARDEIKKLTSRCLTFRKFKSKVGTDAELQAEADLDVSWWEQEPSCEDPTDQQRREFSDLIKKANKKVKDASKAKTNSGRASRYCSAYSFYQTAHEIMRFDAETQKNLQIVLKYFGY